jgi:hypothetical protein
MIPRMNCATDCAAFSTFPILALYDLVGGAMGFKLGQNCRFDRVVAVVGNKNDHGAHSLHLSS